MSQDQNLEGVSRYKDLGELQVLLLQACPPDTNGKRSIPVLSQHLGVSMQYIYRWIEDSAVPPKYVAPLVELSGGKLSFEDFHKFVF